MIIVDSNTWADYFNGTASLHVERLDRALSDEEDIAILPIVVTEGAQGMTDLNGDGDTNDPITYIHDLRTGQTTLLGASFGALVDEPFVAFRVREQDASLDLNNDGDLGDIILHVTEM